jgi:hypothetical protein
MMMVTIAGKISQTHAWSQVTTHLCGSAFVSAGVCPRVSRCRVIHKASQPNPDSPMPISGTINQ